MTGSGRIQLLPDHVINKIAAGEVVERPASVLKELLENALDAGASSIEVSLVDGGRKLIRVADDGSGMNRDDALLAIERHATSKIRDSEDIEHISTLGFRGEALAAISSVSRFTLLTRLAGELEGTEIEISGGRLIHVRAAGCPPGTDIAVRNLFFNVPARKKFLRAAATEQQHARQMFLLHALAHPDVAFRLVMDEREQHRLAAAETLEARLGELYGQDFAGDLVPVDFSREGYRVWGLIGKPTLHRSDRSDQITFVNRRPATAPVVHYALGEVYRGMVPKGRHPVLFLFLEVPPDAVDVNVHPTKKEVRFRVLSMVRDLLIEGLSRALKKPTLDRGADIPAPGARQTAGPALAPETLHLPDLQPPFPPKPPMPQMDAVPAVPGSRSTPPRGASSPGEPVAASPAASSPDSPWGSATFLGTVGNGYAVFAIPEGMLLLDPQAAHERVLYEQYLHQIQSNHIPAQPLLQPETIDLPPVKGDTLRRHLSSLHELGFGISDFGGDTFLVDALPACLGDAPLRALLDDLTTALTEGGQKRAMGDLLRERIARSACATAVGGARRLKEEEALSLLNALAGADMPYTCPHGRPTVILTRRSELDRKFGKG